MNAKLISMGDSGFEGQEKKTKMTFDAVTEVKDADETAQSARRPLNRRPWRIQQIIPVMSNSIALAERYLRMMRDRDKRHRCYVFDDSWNVLSLVLVVLLFLYRKD